MSENWVRITCANAHIMRVGDFLREIDMGAKIDSIITTEPKKSVDDGRDKWEWKAHCFDGSEIDYMITAGWEHYVGDLYIRRDAIAEPEESFTNEEIPITMAA